MTIIGGSIAAGWQAWCWTINLEFTSSSIRSQRELTGNALAFETSKLGPYDTPPLTGPYILMLFK